MFKKEIEWVKGEIIRKQKEFQETAKQCSFCGSYHGKLDEEIHELISQRETLKECQIKFNKFVTTLKRNIGQKCDCIRTDSHREGQCWIYDEIENAKEITT